jgi:long-chain acyl-CoA synthetase
MKFPNERLAIVMGSRSITSAELEAAVNRQANFFRSILRPGEGIAVLLPTCPEYLVSVLAAERAGLDYTPVNVQLATEEAAYIIDDCGAALVVTSVDVGRLAAAVVDRTPRVRRRLILGGPLDGHESLEDAGADLPATPPPLARRPGRPMVYSSGTSGRPKGIVPLEEPRAHRSEDWYERLLSDHLGVTHDSVCLTPGPLHHGAPLRWARATLVLGATLVLLPRFDRRELLATAARHRVTHLQLVPAMMVRIQKLPAAVRANYDLSSLRAVMHTAAPCPIDVKAAWIDWLGPIVWDVYTSSEGFGWTVINSAEWLERMGSVGRAVGCGIHPCDDDGRPLPTGEAGVLRFSDLSGGPVANRIRYHGAPEQTTALYDARGWAAVGDIGYLDEDGYLYLTDRSADTIVAGGVTLFPREIEDVLVTHSAVLDAAVVGAPDPVMGERVVAVVEPVDPRAAGATLAGDLLAYCRERLSGFKCPRQVEFVDRLPRGADGKLRRRLVRDRRWLGSDSKIGTGPAL